MPGRSLWPVGVLLVTALWGLQASSGTARAEGETEGLQVKLVRAIYESDDPVQLVIHNPSSAPVFVAGCGALRPEVFVDDHYEVAKGETCERELKALVVPPGETPMAFVIPPALFGQTARLSLAFGSACIEGRKLSRARCKSFATVYSGPFQVKRATR